MRTLQTAPYIPTSMVRNMKKEELNESKINMNDYLEKDDTLRLKRQIGFSLRE